MKKSVAYLLLFLLGIQLLGVYPLVWWKQVEIRRDVATQIQTNTFEEKLELLVFEEVVYKKLDWKTEKEFWWNNQLYDVVRQKKHPKGYSLYCITDKKETKLLSLFGKKQTKTPAYLGIKDPTSTFSLFFHIESNCFRYTTPTVFSIKQKSFFYQNSYLNFEGCIASPPPKWA